MKEEEEDIEDLKHEYNKELGKLISPISQEEREYLRKIHNEY